MTDINEPSAAKKTLGLSLGGKLELKKTIDVGQVRQSFSHGRSKAVTVEVKRKRVYNADSPGPADETKLRSPEQVLSAEWSSHLTVEERAIRNKVIEEARKEEEKRAIEQQRLRESELKQLEEQKALTALKPAVSKHPTSDIQQDSIIVGTDKPKVSSSKNSDGEEGKKHSSTAAAESTGKAYGIAGATKVTEIADDDTKKPKEKTKHSGRLPSSTKSGYGDEQETEDGFSSARKPGKSAPAAPSSELKKSTPSKWRSGKITIDQALEEEEKVRVRSMASIRRAREKEKQKFIQDNQTEPTKIVREVILPETITVQELSNRMAERSADVIKTLMKMGMLATLNQVLDADTSELVISEFGHKVKRVKESDSFIAETLAQDSAGQLQTRPPVVTVMGHVDHGKTSLLDALRSTDIVSGEAGGITQHIGAYQVTRPSGQKITFIDTPGHAAFSEMRARGANVTDLVVLVVAADDGIMQQTIEAISHAQAAKVPIIVAINKIDKPQADPARVRQELLNHGLVVEELGGDVLAVDVSAKTKLNLDKLEEAILLQAEVLDLKANPDRLASGAVVEARLERGRGSVATFLVQRGTLRVGDILVAGNEWGRVRALLDHYGHPLTEAGPSTPVEVVGLQGTPMAGNQFVVVENENKAREISEHRQRKSRELQAATALGKRGNVEQMLSKIGDSGLRELTIILKSDVQGSLEALVNSLNRLNTAEVGVRILHAGVGGINESDVTLARASRAVIIGFNVRANPLAREIARRDSIDIRYYSIIYNVIDDVKAILGGLLAPTLQEKFLGYAEIRDVFSISDSGKIAGCMVTEGLVKRGAKVRLLRDNVVIYHGSLKNLRRFKDEVKEVKEGYECGMAFDNYQDIAKLDIVECYEIEEVARTLTDKS